MQSDTTGLPTPTAVGPVGVLGLHPHTGEPGRTSTETRPSHPGPRLPPAHPTCSSPSEVRANVSVVLQLSTMSHRRTVLSQEALARIDFIGLKQRPLMGPSWPDRTYNSL